MGTKILYEDIKKYVIENSKCELITKEYTNNTTKMSFKCECGKLFETSFKAFKIANKRQCKECGIENRSAKLRKENIKVCLNCGNKFKYTSKERKFCTYECSCEYKRNTGFKICVICGGKHKGEKECCSRECGYKLLKLNSKKRIEKRLGIKDLEIYLHRLYVIELKTTRQIAQILYGKTTSNSSVLNMLNYYGITTRKGKEAIETQWINAPNRRKITRDRFIRNVNVRLKTDKEENTQKLRKTSEYSEWRLKVYAKAEFTCERCKKKRDSDNKLNAHHLNSFQNNEEQRYDVNNGVCLCEKCHQLFHAKYGNVNNKKEQYNDFILEYKV